MNTHLRKLILAVVIATVTLMLLVGATIVFGQVPAKLTTLLHVELNGDRIAISCTDHKPPKVKSMENEPVVVVDCERAK